MSLKDWLVSLFYQGILYLVHTVIRYGLLFWAFLDEFKRFYNGQVFIWRRDFSYVYIKKTSETLSRLPKHVGLVLEEGEPDYSDLANLTVWAIAMGIPYITMYERTGQLLGQEENILFHIQKKLRKLLGSTAKSIDVRFSHEEPQKGNGFVSRVYETVFGNPWKAHMQHVVLSVFSEEDGKESISRAAKNLSSKLENGELKCKEIDTSVLEAHIKALKRLPDPELLLQFGSIQCLSGFLPWHVRLSEIVCIPSSKGVQFDTFCDALRKYAGCQQRFGK